MTDHSKFRHVPAMAKAGIGITTLFHEETGQTKEAKALSICRVMLLKSLNAGIQESKDAVVAKACFAHAKMVQSQFTVTGAGTKSQSSASVCDAVPFDPKAIQHSRDQHLSERSTASVATDEKGPESPDTATDCKNFSEHSEHQPFFNFTYLPLPFPSCDEHGDFYNHIDSSNNNTSAAPYVEIIWKEQDDMFQDLDDVDSLGTQQMVTSHAHRDEDLVVKMTPLLLLRPSLTGDFARARQESQNVCQEPSSHASLP